MLLWILAFIFLLVMSWREWRHDRTTGYFFRNVFAAFIVGTVALASIDYWSKLP
jgi:hypothetical protein